MIIITILIALLVFLIVILVHEFGHFAVAKLVGIKVNEFAVGMGPKLFQKQKGKLYILFVFFQLVDTVLWKGKMRSLMTQEVL